jgi:hypothetical protein
MILQKTEAFIFLYLYILLCKVKERHDVTVHNIFIKSVTTLFFYIRIMLSDSENMRLQRTSIASCFYRDTSV